MCSDFGILKSHPLRQSTVRAAAKATALANSRRRDRSIPMPSFLLCPLRKICQSQAVSAPVDAGRRLRRAVPKKVFVHPLLFSPWKRGLTCAAKSSKSFRWPPSSSGPGHLVLSQKITGSNPVGGSIARNRPFDAGVDRLSPFQDKSCVAWRAPRTRAIQRLATDRMARTAPDLGVVPAEFERRQLQSADCWIESLRLIESAIDAFFRAPRSALSVSNARRNPRLTPRPGGATARE